jgi:hypothetical protein
MKWVKPSQMLPPQRRQDEPEYGHSEDVLMFFVERDVFCIGWYDHDADAWFIWKGMDDSTRLDGPPDFWQPLLKP